MSNEIFIAKDWPHAPIHRINSDGIFMVTSGTFYKEHFFAGPERLTLLERTLLSLSKRHDWQLEAWSVFSNHYHFVGRNTAKSCDLGFLLKHIHADSARELNRLDGTVGREVWFNFWDTKLTFERSYLARLNYVHQNPVKHGLVYRASNYPWCSAAWFERTASAATVKTIYSFETDKVHVIDDF